MINLIEKYLNIYNSKPVKEKRDTYYSILKDIYKRLALGISQYTPKEDKVDTTWYNYVFHFSKEEQEIINSLEDLDKQVEYINNFIDDLCELFPSTLCIYTKEMNRSYRLNFVCFGITHKIRKTDILKNQYNLLMYFESVQHESIFSMWKNNF